MCSPAQFVACFITKGLLPTNCLMGGLPRTLATVDAPSWPCCTTNPAALSGLSRGRPAKTTWLLHELSQLGWSELLLQLLRLSIAVDKAGARGAGAHHGTDSALPKGPP
uniref:Uncharacterized protein n=1 Tax=Plectus sambesii TaxID=2011161 RepID=A0A914V351_9BILA